MAKQVYWEMALLCNVWCPEMQFYLLFSAFGLIFISMTLPSPADIP